MIGELKRLGKPFVVVLNCAEPASDAAISLAGELSQKYDTPVMPLNVLNATQDDMHMLLERVLYEFPITRVHFDTPGWARCPTDTRSSTRSRALCAAR